MVTDKLHPVARQARNFPRPQVEEASRTDRQDPLAFKGRTQLLGVVEKQAGLEAVAAGDRERRLAETRVKPNRLRRMVEADVVHGREGVGLTRRVLRPLLKESAGVAPRLAFSVRMGCA